MVLGQHHRSCRPLSRGKKWAVGHDKMAQVVRVSEQGQWVTKKQHRSCGSLSSLQWILRFQHRFLSSSWHVAVGPEATSEVQRAPELPAVCSVSRYNSTGH